MDGSLVFVRWRLCAPPHDCLGHRSPNPKGHLDRFSHFCTAHGSPSKLPLPMGDLGPI